MVHIAEVVFDYTLIPADMLKKLVLNWRQIAWQKGFKDNTIFGDAESKFSK